MSRFAWALLIIIGLVVLWLISTYNSLVRRRNRVEEAWSDIDVQLKRRYDLIPNLIETVKGYAKHEQGTLDTVITARAEAMKVHDTKGVSLHAQQEAENMLASTLKSIFALSEAYPDLKANQNFLQLQDELSDTENKIQAARRFYNGTVRDFNTALESFPTNVIANTFGFKKREFFEAESQEKNTVGVKF